MKKLIFVLLITLSFGKMSASTIYVDGSASGSDNGTSWTNAYVYLQDALGVAVSGDIIYVAQGSYYPDQGDGQVSGDKTSTFTVPSGVKVYGGYPSGGGSRNVSVNTTTLSANLGLPWVSSDNAYNVVTFNNADSNTRLDGFTVRDGMATGQGQKPTEGSGIWSSNSDMTVSNCIVENNHCHNLGGGIYIEGAGSSPVMEDCIVRDNEAFTGGGIYTEDATSTHISNTSIQSNNCLTGGNGGGFFAKNVEDVILDKCYIQGNSSTFGGGVKLESSTMDLINSVVSGNEAETTGGAIFLNASKIDIIACTLSGNYAQACGGISQEECNASLTSTITSSILYGDKGQYTGATYYDEVGNSSGNTTTYITYSYSNIAGSGGSVSWTSFFGTDGGNNIDIDPLFVVETDYNAVPTTDGDLRLQMGSPSLGSGSLVADGEETDLDGASRPLPVIATQVDMGAYEKDETDIPSPVRLVEFTGLAESGSIVLNWETASETENAAFELYRDSEIIATVQGAGSSSENHYYSVSDECVQAGRSYVYTLWTVGMDQEKECCGGVTVNMPAAAAVSADFVLADVFPNPFNPSTRIHFSVSQETNIRLTIFDTNGHEVDRLIDTRMSAGEYDVNWSPEHLPAGIYLACMTSSSERVTRKILYVK